MGEKPEIVRSLAEAVAGDTVWIFNSERPVFVDGQYRGRGVWDTATIDGETKQSFIIDRYGKFDRNTGLGRVRNGYASCCRIAGEDERETAKWQAAAWHIARAVEGLRDAEKLKQIAAIVGWNPSE